MSRPDRWWRPSTARRPAQRARARRMYTGKELDKTFDVGYTVGQADEAKRARKRDDMLHRLAEACEEADRGDPGPLAELCGEAAGDDLLDVADAAGVLDGEEDKALWDSVPPSLVDDPERLLAEVEQFLREQDGNG